MDEDDEFDPNTLRAHVQAVQTSRWGRPTAECQFCVAAKAAGLITGELS